MTLDEDKPDEVRRSTKLLWVAWCGGLAVRWLVFGTMSLFLGVSLLSVMLAGPIAEAFLIFMLSSGRRWARTIYLLLFIPSVWYRGWLIYYFISTFPKTMLAVLAVLIAESWALVLLFSAPSNEWFRDNR